MLLLVFCSRLSPPAALPAGEWCLSQPYPTVFLLKMAVVEQAHDLTRMSKPTVFVCYLGHVNIWDFFFVGGGDSHGLWFLGLPGVFLIVLIYPVKSCETIHRSLWINCCNKMQPFSQN